MSDTSQYMNLLLEHHSQRISHRIPLWRHKPLFTNTSGIWGHNTHSFTFIQTEDLSSQTQESSTLLMQNPANTTVTHPLLWTQYISTRTALSPQDHWSIARLNIVPYWHGQPAGLHSRFSICLINSICFKCTERSIGVNVALNWPRSSEKCILLSVLIKGWGCSSHDEICVISPQTVSMNIFLSTLTKQEGGEEPRSSSPVGEWDTIGHQLPWTLN